MFGTLRRLHPRGPSSRGIAVDAEGAVLGPDCVLIRRTPQGFRCVAPGEARAIQAAALAHLDAPDWLFEQCRHIANALAVGETALAQIYGLRIPVGELDDAALRRLRALAPLLKAGFNPDEPRIPKGEPGAGQWTNGEDSGADTGGGAGDAGGDAGSSGDSGAGSDSSPSDNAGGSEDDAPSDTGQATTEDSRPAAETTVAERDRKSICIERCAHLLERPKPYRWSDVNTFAFFRCVNDCMSEAE